MLLQTSEVGLIIREEDCVPFWTEQSKELSEKLWCPIETDCVALDSTLSSTLSIPEVGESWFSNQLLIPLNQKWSKTLPVSSMSSVVGYTGLENTKKSSKKPVKKKKQQVCKETQCENEVLQETNRVFCAVHFEERKNDKYCNGSHVKECKYKASFNGFCAHHITVPKDPSLKKQEKDSCRKIKLKPTLEQKKILRKMFGISRLCYNTAVKYRNSKKFDMINDNNCSKVHEELLTLDYVNEMPYKLAEESFRDFTKAKSNCDEKMKTTGQYQVMRPKSKKKASDSIGIIQKGIRKHDDNSIIMFPRKLRNLGPIKTAENISKLIFDNDCRLIVKHRKYYYLSVPTLLIKEPIKPVYKDSIVAIDPGKRTFNTFYSPLLAGQIGINPESRLKKIFNEYDRVKSKHEKTCNKAKKSTGKKRKQLAKKAKRLQRKYLSIITKPSRLVKDLHQKAALFYCRTFDTIVIPEYSCKDRSGKLHKSINRCDNALSHYKFRQVLLHTAKRFQRKVHFAGEAYTTMTCTLCGHINNKSSNEVLTCRSCKVTMNRDFRGSRNFFLKFVKWYNNTF